MSPECRAREAHRGCALQVTAAHDPKPISKPATGSRFRQDACALTVVILD
jgi:hypothetical protein